MPSKKNTLHNRRILVAVLNWGLGHATRSIPVIEALIHRGAKVHIASDGAALEVLAEAFPELPQHELPAYNVRYAKPPWTLSALLIRMPAYGIAMNRELKRVRELHRKYHFNGLVSDNRPASRIPGIPTAYITHQLCLPAGKLSTLVSRAHAFAYRHFDEIWIPDDNARSLSGDLSKAEKDTAKKIRFLGPLSRLNPKQIEKKFTWAAVLSGLEPARTKWEQEILSFAPKMPGKGLLVRGLPGKQPVPDIAEMEIINYVNANELSDIYSQSEAIIARSGYSTLMDLEAMGARAILVPTPGQGEQEYLARHVDKAGWATGTQGKVDYPDMLKKVLEIPRPQARKAELPDGLFALFESK